jgi:hypothetical protein
LHNGIAFDRGCATGFCNAARHANAPPAEDCSNAGLRNRRDRVSSRLAVVNFPKCDLWGFIPEPISNRSASHSVEFLGESYEKAFWSADVAESIRILIPDYFTYKLCAALPKFAKRLVDVVHGEHDAEVAQSIYWGVAVIRDDRWHEKAGELETAVAVRRAHHRNLDALIAKAGDPSCPFSFDRGPLFKLKAELSKEINCFSKVIDDDSYVIHSFERHASNLQSVA